MTAQTLEHLDTDLRDRLEALYSRLDEVVLEIRRLTRDVDRLRAVVDAVAEGESQDIPEEYLG